MSTTENTGMSDSGAQGGTIDVARLEALEALGADTILTFVTLFCKVAREQLAVITEARTRRNVDALRFAAHSLKGSARNMGLCCLSDLCKDIEMACKAGETHQALELAETVDQHVAEAVSALRERYPGAPDDVQVD